MAIHFQVKVQALFDKLYDVTTTDEAYGSRQIITKAALCRLFDLDPVNISRYCRGDRPFSLDWLMYIIRALDAIGIHWDIRDLVEIAVPVTMPSPQKFARDAYQKALRRQHAFKRNRTRTGRRRNSPTRSKTAASESVV